MTSKTDDDFDIPESGAVFTFGKSRFADNTPSKFWIKNDLIIEVACGDEHTAVVTGSGRVFMLGNNTHGQLGISSFKPTTKPMCVKALKPDHDIIKASGYIYTWGDNGDGQLGTCDFVNHSSPEAILQLQRPAVTVAAGSSHSCLVTDTGELFVWGSNQEGQLGLAAAEVLKPTQLDVKEPVVDVACGYYHTIILTEAGRVFTCGESASGKLGLGEDNPPFISSPQLVSLSEKVTQIAAGSSHSVLLTENGLVLTCGLGSNGQLGQGAGQLQSQIFQQIISPPNLTYVSIAAGDSHCAALTDNGKVVTWGCGRHGKLCHGEENFSSQFSPVVVNRLRHLYAALIDCGGCHTMVLGFRRKEETVDGQSNSKPSDSLSNLARARRRVNDGALPPLKTSGLPPLKPSVLPTVPDNEEHINEVVQNDTGENQDVTGDWCNPSEIDSDKNATDLDNQFNSCENNNKKVGKFRRLFSGWGKKKSASSHVADISSENETENLTVTEVSVAKNNSDADIPSPDSSDAVSRQTLAADEEVEEIISGRPLGSQKNSRACVIL